jgi:predicted DCC family thiol-disulfide oxidoreductase YuxK
VGSSVPRLPRPILAYDADCGPCTRFRHFVELIDSKGEFDFVSLIEADDSGLLDRIAESERHTSFHVILPDGELLTGPAAIPRLVELLPGGKTLSAMITSIPGGTHLVSIVYEGFARGHNGSACRYPRPIARSRFGAAQLDSVVPADPGPARSTYLLTGMIGGLLGSLAMGLSVHVPDALCVALATAIEGPSASTAPLAWALHIVTAVLIGASFGWTAGFLRIKGRRSLGRSLLLGLSTGIAVWLAFFLPLMLTFLSSLVTQRFLASSLVAHVLLGLVLGTTLAGMLLVRSKTSSKVSLAG